MGECLRILEPVDIALESKQEALAPRISNLQGKTFLLLDNLKPGAMELLTKVGALLKSKYDANLIVASKVPTYSRASTLEDFRTLLGENLGKVHLAITALGD